jgi:hypothetical protein
VNRLPVCEQILDLARWAPSGDNTQPWRFEIRGQGDRDIVIHGFDTREHCVYDLDGHPSQMALGALLETVRIAATAHGLRADVARRSGMPDDKPTFDVHLTPDAAVSPSPLISAITARAVQRRPLRTTPLTAQQKLALEAAVAPRYRVVWFESLTQRWQVAKLLFQNAKLRLTLPEAYAVHSSVIEWGARFSTDRIPEQAVGVDPMTAKLMRWVMQSWPRVAFFNTWLGGTLMPRLQLDLLPGLLCGAHAGIAARETPVSVDDYVDAGRALQRFWLEVTRQGLWLQPEMTPVIFGRYQREGRAFTRDAAARSLGVSVAAGYTSLFGDVIAGQIVFLARVGCGQAPRARSTRRALDSLIVIK